MSTPAGSAPPAPEDDVPVGPRLREDYRVQAISDRTRSLREGLTPSWRLHASYDTEQRRKDGDRPDAFTVHLLHRPGDGDADGWAALALLNEHWANARGRHRLITTALERAHVAPTLTALAQHFTSTAAEHDLPRTPTRHPTGTVSEAARLDIVNLILDQPDPHRDATALLVGLSPLGRDLHERRDLLALLNAIGAAVDNARFLLCLTRNHGATTAAPEQWLIHAIETCVRLHWNPATQTLGEDYEAAREVVFRAHYGDRYDTLAATYPTVVQSSPR